MVAFAAVGPIALGGGLLGQCRWEVVSHRQVIGRQAAYNALELSPPKSVNDVLAWKDPLTNISWLQLRGLKVVGGIYAIAHAGGVVDLEGVWQHKVKKEIELNHLTGYKQEII